MNYSVEITQVLNGWLMAVSCDVERLGDQLGSTWYETEAEAIYAAIVWLKGRHAADKVTL